MSSQKNGVGLKDSSAPTHRRIRSSSTRPGAPSITSDTHPWVPDRCYGHAGDPTACGVCDGTCVVMDLTASHGTGVQGINWDFNALPDESLPYDYDCNDADPCTVEDISWCIPAATANGRHFYYAHYQSNMDGGMWSSMAQYIPIEGICVQLTAPSMNLMTYYWDAAVLPAGDWVEWPTTPMAYDNPYITWSVDADTENLAGVEGFSFTLVKDAPEEPDTTLNLAGATREIQYADLKTATGASASRLRAVPRMLMAAMPPTFGAPP